MIIKSYDVIGGRGSATVQALFDTGSAASFVRRDIAERIGYVVEIPGGSEQFTLADGTGSMDVEDEVSSVSLSAASEVCGSIFWSWTRWQKR